MWPPKMCFANMSENNPLYFFYNEYHSLINIYLHSELQQKPWSDQKTSLTCKYTPAQPAYE